MTEKHAGATSNSRGAGALAPGGQTLIIHRHGRLEPGDQIVMVACAHRPHRQAALEACQFLIDWLKTKAPFWKREEGAGGAQWVEARDTDDAAAARWDDTAAAALRRSGART